MSPGPGAVGVKGPGTVISIPGPDGEVGVGSVGGSSSSSLGFNI